MPTPGNYFDRAGNLFAHVLVVLLDLFVAVFQSVCSPVHGIPRMHRGDYRAFDREHLAYLNIVEKLNCAYCAYANGVFAYAPEVASRTEEYWCPIKHVRRVLGIHSRYSSFVDYGDADGYRHDWSVLVRSPARPSRADSPAQCLSSVPRESPATVMSRRAAPRAFGHPIRTPPRVADAAQSSPSSALGLGGDYAQDHKRRGSLPRIVMGLTFTQLLICLGINPVQGCLAYASLIVLLLGPPLRVGGVRFVLDRVTAPGPREVLVRNFLSHL